jgi:hypothetical protein
VVGDGAGQLTIICRFFEHIADVGGPVEQGKLGMAVEMGEMHGQV